jgi:hypothetical protein
MNAAEVALLNDRNDMFGGGGGAFFWVFALLLLSGGGFGFGGRGPMPDVATKEFVQDSVNNQSVQNGLRDVLLSSANNNYETALLINNQTNQMLQQNSTNLINAIQGFNQVNQKIDQLGYHLDQCCCEIKTQMLQNRLDDAQAALVAAQGNISNANQSQYILSQLGRFVAWTPSGTQASTGT